MSLELLLVLLLPALLLLAYVVSHNRFVRQQALVAESWRQVDVELRRRHELIPNLVAVVEGRAAHERALVAQALSVRTAASRASASSGSPGAVAPAEDALTAAVAGLMTAVGTSGALATDGTWTLLQSQLAETEDRIAAARRFYNGNVRALNTRVASFPSSLVAQRMGLPPAEHFEVDDPAVRAAPVVSLGGAAPGSAPRELPAGEP